MRRPNNAQTTCVTSTDQRKYISIVGAIAKHGIKSSKENALYSTLPTMDTMRKSSKRTTFKF